ncbi:MAG TPA: choice-of-anchor D domain-containing protein, partial [Candidatus Eisenbacteria bacterium]|nr:choice-of-anchor D domain-containing protein [Candidatus Eisenbacteria bacterium]
MRITGRATMRTPQGRFGAYAVLLALLLAARGASAAGTARDIPVSLASVTASRAASFSGAVIQVAPPSLNFGTITIGQTSTRSLTISNSGNENLALASVIISDVHFTTSFTTPIIIPTGGAATLTVTYAPTTATPTSASLTLLSNATNGTVTVPVSGIGADPGPPNPGEGRLLAAPTGESAGDQYGISVGSAGDLNGDGLGDVIVGAWSNDAAGGDAGRAYIYFGSAVPSEVPSLILTGAAAGDNFGTSVGTAGDFN